MYTRLSDSLLALRETEAGGHEGVLPAPHHEQRAAVKMFSSFTTQHDCREYIRAFVSGGTCRLACMFSWVLLIWSCFVECRVFVTDDCGGSPSR